MMSAPMRRAQRRSSIVLLGEGGDGDGDAGEVEALVVGDHAAFDDGGVDAGAVDRGDFEGDACRRRRGCVRRW